MSLTVSDVVYDESFTPDVTDNDAASLTADLTTAIGALSLNYYTAPTGFPQYAERANFVSSDQAVTSYFLTSDSSGDPFSTSTGVATDLYVGSDQISLYATSDPNVVVGRIGGASGDVVLVIALNGDAAHPELGIAVYAPLVHSDGSAVDDADTLNLDGLLYLGSNFATVAEHDFDSFAGVPSGSDAFAMILPDGVNDLQLLATGFTGTTEQKITISQDANAGSIGGGGSGQHVGSGNSLRIDFISGGDFSKADTASEDNNLANISYTQHEEADKASFQLVQINPGTAGTTTSLNIFAYDDVGNYQGASFASNASSNEGTITVIDPSNVHVLDAHGNPAAGVTITAVGGGGVHITGLQLNYTVVFGTPGDQFDRFTVTNTQPAHGAGSNVTFDIGHIHVTTETTGSGTEFTNIGDNTIFEDAGPSVSLSGDAYSLTVDETHLNTDDSGSFAGVFNASYGPDGGGSVDYAFGIKSTGQDSTLVDTATGHGIFLYMDGSDVVGLVGSGLNTADPSGAEAFRISIDSGGTVTLDQSRAVSHSDPNATDESTNMVSADLVTLTATVTDSDGDSVSQVANIATSFNFLDDEPTALAPNPGNSLIVGNTNSGGPIEPYSYTASDSFSTFNAGNDGVGSFTIVGPADSSGDYTWAYGSGGTDQTTIIESYKGTQLFSLALDSTGGYTMTMLGTLPYSQLNLDANNIKAGGPTGSIDVGTINDGGDYVQISGTYNNTGGQLNGTTGGVNASNANVGVNNGNLDGGEALFFSLFTSTGTLVPIYGLDMGTKTAQGASYHLYGVLDSDHTTVVDLGSQTLPKGGVIHYAGNVLLDSIIVEETAGSAVKIGLAGVHLLLPPADAGFHFTAQLTDGDGDAVTAPFNVFIDGNNDGVVDTSHVIFPA